LRRRLTLTGEKDAKLMGVIPIVKDPVGDGFRPIRYCRYIATAAYLDDELRRRLRDMEVVAVTRRSQRPATSRPSSAASLPTTSRRALQEVGSVCIRRAARQRLPYIPVSVARSLPGA
jgi:hypothetical protein